MVNLPNQPWRIMKGLCRHILPSYCRPSVRFLPPISLVSILRLSNESFWNFFCFLLLVKKEYPKTSKFPFLDVIARLFCFGPISHVAVLFFFLCLSCIFVFILFTFVLSADSFIFRDFIFHQLEPFRHRLACNLTFPLLNFPGVNNFVQYQQLVSIHSGGNFSDTFSFKRG